MPLSGSTALKRTVTGRAPVSHTVCVPSAPSVGSRSTSSITGVVGAVSSMLSRDAVACGTAPGAEERSS